MNYVDFMFELRKMYSTKLWENIYEQTGVYLGVDDIKPQDVSLLLKTIKKSNLPLDFKTCLEEYILIQSGPNECRLENICTEFKQWCNDRGIMLSRQYIVCGALVKFCMEMPCFYDLQVKCLFFYFT